MGKKDGGKEHIKKERRSSAREGALLFLLPAIGMLVLTGLMIANLLRYRSYLIEQQEKEFLRLAKSMRFGTEEFLRSEKLSLESLAISEDAFIGTDTTFNSEQLQAYLTQRPQTRCQMLVIDGRGEEGKILMRVDGAREESIFRGDVYAPVEELEAARATVNASEKASQMTGTEADDPGKLSETGGASVVVGKARQVSEHAYLVPMIRYLPSRDAYLVVMCGLDELRDFLNHSLSDEKNAYVALKNQEGYILSHKNLEQIGLHMVEGRKEKYPELDFSGYDRIMEMQMTGEEATAVYESYWFDRTPIRRAKKIASFTPIQLDCEFWVLTLNLDYETYMGPLRSFMVTSILLMCLILLGAGMMFFYLLRQRAAEEKVMRENAWLSELQTTHDKLQREREQKIRAMKTAQLGSMTSKIAHEFKNFLLPIIGCAEFIMEDEETGDAARQDAGSILEYAEKANELTRELSRLGRNTVAEQQREAENSLYGNGNGVKTDIGDTIRIFTEGLVRARPDGIVLRQDIAADCGVTSGSETQLQEVFWNLAKNAIDAIGEKRAQNKAESGETPGTADETNTLSVKAELIPQTELPADVMASLSDAYSRIVFADTGCGMGEETQKQIFLTYFTTKGSGEGNGLGLSIVYDIVTAMGGDILVESEEGQGTTFTIYLPVEAGSGQTNR